MLSKIMNVILQFLMKNSYTVYLQEKNVTILNSYFKKTRYLYRLLSETIGLVMGV
jgi:hypothetical protein